MAFVKLHASSGEEYMFRERATGTNAISEIFASAYNHYLPLSTEQLKDAGMAEQTLPIAGEI